MKPPETGKHFFYKNEMHDILHYDGGQTVKIAPSLRHDAFIIYTLGSTFKKNQVLIVGSRYELSYIAIYTRDPECC
jgi:hypothetical protein